MKKVLIYAGTTEGRMLAERLSAAGIACDVRVATEYGQMAMPELSHVKVHVGRLKKEEMRLLAERGYAAVVDATHPFATEVSKNIVESLQGQMIPYFRLQRQTSSGKNAMEDRQIQYFSDHAACAGALAETSGNILLTTGSRELSVYCGIEGLRERLFVRVLPGHESIAACEELGICGRQLIAMQGPFSKEMNLALIRQFSIRHLVTKESGANGGFGEKLEAAAEEQICTYVIRNPESHAAVSGEQGMSFHEVTQALGKLLDQDIADTPEVSISLVGLGMGPATLTQEGKQAIEEADLLFGASRMLEGLAEGRESYPYYLAEDIIPVLRKKVEEEEHGALKAAVIFSGDTGFYSGSTKIKTKFEKSGYKNIKVYPGISSVSYLAAAVGETWQDAKILSIHGRKDKQVWRAQLLDAVTCHARTFLLVSGVEDVREVGKILTEVGLGACTLVCGYQLSYPQEQMIRIMAFETDRLTEEGLYTCLIQNPAACSRRVAPGVPDTAFLRDQVPMTKEEIRQVSICKLGLTEHAVVYDVGSGTGSIAVECGLRSPDIRVYAIEQKPQAQELLRRNLERFQLSNVIPVNGTAPAALEELEAPTHVFIGGSGGKLEAVLQSVWAKNPEARVVLNAVSLETIAEVTRMQKEFCPPEGFRMECDCVQLQVSRARELGNYHLMQAENPVYIFCMELHR